MVTAWVTSTPDRDKCMHWLIYETIPVSYMSYLTSIWHDKSLTQQSNPRLRRHGSTSVPSLALKKNWLTHRRTGVGHRDTSLPKIPHVQAHVSEKLQKWYKNLTRYKNLKASLMKKRFQLLGMAQYQHLTLPHRLPPFMWYLMASNQTGKGSCAYSDTLHTLHLHPYTTPHPSYPGCNPAPLHLIPPFSSPIWDPV